MKTKVKKNEKLDLFEAHRLSDEKALNIKGGGGASIDPAGQP